MSRIKIFFSFLIFLIYGRVIAINQTDQDRILAKVDLAVLLQANNPDSALQLGFEILKESRQINYVEGVGYASVRIGSIFNLRGQNDSAIYYLNNAYQIRKELQDYSGAAAVVRYLGYVYKETGQLDSAFASFYHSIKLIKVGKDTIPIVRSYLELAHLLCDYEDLEQARIYYDKSYNMASSIDDSSSLAYCYEGYGKFYHHQEEYELALENYLKAAEIHSELFNKTDLATTYNNIAVCYDNLKAYKLATKFYKISLKLCEELGYVSEISLRNYNLGICFNKLKLYDSSIHYLTRAREISSENGDVYRQARVNKKLSLTFANKGDYLKAYQSYIEYTTLKDSLLSNEKISSISEMQTKYETEKKEQQIVLLDEQNKTKEAQKKFLFATVVSLLLLVLILSFFYIQRKRIAKKNELIAEQKIEGLLDEQEIKTYNAMLEGQEEERMRIATDLHDRLGSMLSTVKLLFSALDDKVDKTDADSKQQYDKANHLIDETCAEVRRVSHNLGTGMAASFGLIRALEELCESINQSDKIECSLQSHGLEEGSLQLNIEIGIYRMVQEAVNNALKYSKAKSLSVQLTKHEDSISIIIEDNGIGFNLETAKAKGGMGLRNIEMRASKLNGSMHIDTKKGRGTTTIIELPILTMSS